MPATTPNPGKPTPQNGNGRDNGAPLYVRAELSTEQKLMLAEWAEALEWQDLMAWADAMADNNMVITLKRIPDTKGFQCSVTGTKGSTKENLCLVTRASTATKALISAMYKDVMVLQGIWQGVKREEDFDL